MPATLAIPQIGLRHRLRIAREHAELSVADMADALARSRNTIGNYEAGRSTPPPRVVKRWAELCGVPFSWLDEGTGAALTSSPPRKAARHHRVSADTVAVTAEYQWRPRMAAPVTRNRTATCYTKVVV